MGKPHLHIGLPIHRRGSATEPKYYLAWSLGDKTTKVLTSSLRILLLFPVTYPELKQKQSHYPMKQGNRKNGSGQNAQELSKAAHALKRYQDSWIPIQCYNSSGEGSSLCSLKMGNNYTVSLVQINILFCQLLRFIYINHKIFNFSSKRADKAFW